LQDYCQKNFQQTPIYDVLIESGPDHSKIFEILVRIDQKKLGQGRGLSKKEAQQAAAADALSRFSKPHL
jgi:ribonuclease-3